MRILKDNVEHPIVRQQIYHKRSQVITLRRTKNSGTAQNIFHSKTSHKMIAVDKASEILCFKCCLIM